LDLAKPASGCQVANRGFP